MNLARWSCLFWGSLLLAGTPQYSEINVNARYRVESVELTGESESKISSGLREQMTSLVGEYLNPGLLDELSKRIASELHVRTVTHRILRGTRPDHVRVVFEVKNRLARFDLSVPRVLYHSNEGLNGVVEGTATVGAHAFTLGFVSDGDELAERYTGVRARYTNKRVGTDRLGFRFLIESYHVQWNQATQMAQASAGDRTPGIYRDRQNLEPAATVVLARPLSLSFGASFQSFQTQVPAARTQAANSLVTTLRYHRVLEDSGNQHDLDAGYSLRAATRLLNSDYAYVRHHWSLRYRVSRGRHMVTDDLTAGLITGRAPLFERFALGNSSTLRGWNKFDLDPLGGSRAAHNSLEYRYRLLEVFYDTGAVWDPGQTARLRHSSGLGVRLGVFSALVAFPVREGRIDPVFMVAMNY